MELIKDVVVGIVDDNVVNVRLLEGILKRYDFQVETAISGEGALVMVDRHTIDIMLLDIMMPEMDGIETCRLIKQTNYGRNIPVIFLTALDETEEKLRAFEAGGVDYITKPFVKEEVLARLNVHMKLKRAIEKLEEISVTDELTGVFNRRFAYEMIFRMIENSKRDNSDFLICYVDVDNLKIVNDTYGHSEGDRLISVVVQAFKASVRKTDYIFRMGGDEFLILLPGATMDIANEMVRRVNNGLGDACIQDQPVSFSYGFTACGGGSDVSVDNLIKSADEKMYEQKAAKKKNRGFAPR